MTSQPSDEDITPSQTVPAEDDLDHTAPLLGPPGSVRQRSSQPLRMNIVLGAAPLAQIGVWGLALAVWYNVIFRADWILFTFHPVLSLLWRC